MNIPQSKKTYQVNDQSKVAPRKQYVINFVTSKDGTLIGYRQYGHGPGLVLMQGMMGTAHNFDQLAVVLADTFTVFVPDRRGRGLSGDAGKDYSIEKEVEDLDALLTQTGAHHIFGLSAGAIVSLQAALTLSAIHKLAIFEPPLFINGTLPTAQMARYEKEMAQGKIAAALVTAMRAGKFGPPILNVMPRWLLESFVNRIIKIEEKNGSGEYASMKDLAFTLHNDFQLVSAMSDKLENFSAIHTHVLLLGGGKSPAYFKTAVDALEKVLPNVKRIEFPELGHAAAWNYDSQRNPDGQPEVVAQELQQFFQNY
jgi:pimeloyl-ACP methyl ester carboxylesterase